MLVSDHGFYLGDYGYTGKIANVLHPALIHVPLIVIDPRGRRAGRTTAYPASTHDVGPTILSMAGVPVPSGMDGVDLSRFFEGRRPPARPVLVRRLRQQLLRAHRPLGRMYGLNSGGRPHLFDRRSDPGEGRDVAAAHPGKARQLRGVVRHRAGRLPTFPY